MAGVALFRILPAPKYPIDYVAPVERHDLDASESTSATAHQPMLTALPLGRRLFFALCIALMPGAAAWAQATDAIEVRGAVKASLHLSVDDLRHFPVEQIASFTQSPHEDGGAAASTVRGVRLTAVLDRAGLASTDRNDWKKAVVVATASDGYRVAFSWPELFNTEVGANVLVVFERDGQPLSPAEGRIGLISGNDQRTGPRHVRWLQSVEVRVLSP